MYTIAADGGGCLHHGHHVHAGLKHLIGDDEAYVARAHHDYPGAGLDMVKIDHGLGGAGGHHSRQGGAPEVQVVLVGAGGNDDLFGSDGLHAVLAAVQGQVVLKNAVDRMAQQDLHVVRFRVRQQMLADVEAPHAGVVLPGAKELVDLLKELTARLLVFVDDQHLGAPAGRRDTGGKGPPDPRR